MWYSNNICLDELGKTGAGWFRSMICGWAWTRSPKFRPLWQWFRSTSRAPRYSRTRSSEQTPPLNRLKRKSQETVQRKTQRVSQVLDIPLKTDGSAKTRAVWRNRNTRGPYRRSTSAHCSHILLHSREKPNICSHHNTLRTWTKIRKHLRSSWMPPLASR